MATKVQVAAVITGGPKAHTPLFRQFVQVHFPDVSEVELIQYPQAEYAFVYLKHEPGKHAHNLTACACNAMREIIESRVLDAYHRGVRHCAIIPYIAVEPEYPDFEACREFTRRARDEVRKWANFDAFALGLFTRSGKLIPYDSTLGLNSKV